MYSLKLDTCGALYLETEQRNNKSIVHRSKGKRKKFLIYSYFFLRNVHIP